MAKNDYQLGQARINAGGRGPMRVMEKPKDFKNALLELTRYLKSFLLPLSLAFACAIAGVVMNLFGPDMLSRITNLIESGMRQGNVDLPLVIRYSLLALSFYALSSLLVFTQSVTLARTTQNIQRHMRNDISRKLNRIPLKRFDSASFGDLLSRHHLYSGALRRQRRSGGCLQY